MQLITKEHQDIIAQFEKEYKYLRLDKEPQESWSKGIIYQNGDTNNMFKCYRNGYALGRCVYLNQ